MASSLHASDPRLVAFMVDKVIASITHIGSAVKILRVAEGAADFYPRRERTFEWDTAWPHAVLEAVGGQMLDMEGAPLTYAKSRWENPPFLRMGAR